MDIELLLKRKLESSKEEERVQAVRELSGLISDSSMALLYQALGDISWRVRKQAAESFLSFPRAGELAGDIAELLHDQDNVGLRNIAIEILVKLGNQAIPVLLNELQAPDRDVRKFVLDILGDIGDPASSSQILPALKDEDQNVRAAAAENLGKIGAAEAVPALLEAMSGADLLLKFSILEALGKIGGPLPVDLLLPYHQDPMLRKALFDCIGNALLGEGIPLLVAGLEDHMRHVREAALLALNALYEVEPVLVSQILSESNTAAEALPSFLNSDNDTLVRAALQLLPLVKEIRCAEQLLALLDHEDFRQLAAEILVALGRPALVPLLDHWSNNDDRTRCYLANLAGVTGCEEAEPLLLAGLQSNHANLRMACAQALGCMGKLAVLPTLLELMHEGRPEQMPIVQGSLRALAERYPEKIMDKLMPLLDDSVPAVRIAAINTLAGINGKNIERRLLLALKDESAAVRCSAVRAFTSCPDDCRLEALALALTDEDSDVRQAAAEAFGSVRADQAVDALALALFDEDIWVRAAVLQSLGRIGFPRCIALIKDSLGDPVGLVCMIALRALAEIDPAGAFPHLIAALYHTDEEVINAALELLTLTGRQDWLASMVDVLLNHPHWEVRLSFSRAVESLAAASLLPAIEERLLVEGEEIVRHQLESLLRTLKVRED